jgi:DNA polymerase (family 10)
MGNRDVARVLHEIADLLDIKGENVFRIRSYRIGGDAVAAYGEDVADMLKRGVSLRTIDGVGEGIADKIRQIVASGDCDAHRELLREVPRGLLELLQISGLGPKGVSLVWRELGVTGAGDLERAIADGRFRALPGMKEKKEARVLKGLEALRAARQKQPAAAPAVTLTPRFLFPVAAEAAERLGAYLKERGAERVEPVGSFRRRRETIGDLDLIVVGGDAAALGEAFVTHPDVREVLGHGAAKCSVVLRSGLQVDLRPFEPSSLGAAMQYFTGSKTHNVALRERAQKRGLKLNEYGVFRVADDVKLAGATEEDVYAALGLPWIAPELREDRGEIAAAEAGALPELIEVDDVRGDLHAHTAESDGTCGAEELVAAARRRGLDYLALTEHSLSVASPAHGTGLDEARCRAHVARVRAIQKRLRGFRLLAGVEVDILPDGSLDLADDALGSLDLVVAAIHSAYDLPREQQTERVLRALRNPHVHVWAHPLSRRLPERAPVEIDFERALDEAVRLGVALEINAQPKRLDLPDHLIRHARDKGARFVISTDSHATGDLDTLWYAVAQARRGWLTVDDVLNTKPAAEFLKSLRSRG